MKKSRIQTVRIHRVKISKEEQKEILERLTDYHAKAIKQKLDKYNLSREIILHLLLLFCIMDLTAFNI